MKIFNKVLIIIVSLGVIGFMYWLLFGYFQIQTIWTNTIVEEDVPVIITDEAVNTDSESSNSSDTSSESETSILLEDNNIDDNQLRLLSNTSFQQGESSYNISGNAQITSQSNNTTLSLTDFTVTNGPDLFVYLVNSTELTKDSVNSNVANGNYISVAELKGNIGNQNYDVSDIDLDEYNTIVIWCEDFARNFGYASYSF